MLAQALKSREAIPRNQLTGQGLLDVAAAGLGPVPLLGDAMGLLADSSRFYNDPNSRTPLNFGLAALGALPFIPNVGPMAKKLTPREKQLAEARAGRLDSFDDEYRFTNLNNLVPKDYLPPQFGQEFVTVYRGIPHNSNTKQIMPGDWVALDKKYASQHGTGESGKSIVVEMKVPASEIGWAGTDMNEYFYVPKTKKP